jgi:hypothetical protein
MLAFLFISGRGAGIRTRDLYVPNVARYQAALLPVNITKKFDMECPRGDSNARHRLRRPVLYPLSYGGQQLTIAVARASNKTEATLLY